MKTRISLADRAHEGQGVQEPFGEIEIRISRRNILSLLHKLDWPGSACTIQKFQDNVIVTLIAEDDEEHYGNSAAGVMHDETERFIESYGEDK